MAKTKHNILYHWLCREAQGDVIAELCMDWAVKDMTTERTTSQAIVAETAYRDYLQAIIEETIPDEYIESLNELITDCWYDDPEIEV